MSFDVKDAIIRFSRPIVRAGVRYCPLLQVRRILWDRCAKPMYAWRPYWFTTTTTFGAAISGNTGDLIPSHLYYFGLWEPAISAWIASRLRAGDTFVDVGSNIGYFSLLAANRVGRKGKIVSIEACPTVYDSLERNCSLNAYGNIRTVHVAVSDRAGTVTLYRGPEKNSGAATIITDGNATGGTTVAALPLPDILKPEECESLRLIKVDVEGAEYLVLSGALPLLKSAGSQLEVVVELHPGLLSKQGRSVDDVFALMKSAGFQAYSFGGDSSDDSYFRPVRVQRPHRVYHTSEVAETVVFSHSDLDSI